MDRYFFRLKVWIDSGTLPRMSEPVSTQRKPAPPGTLAAEAAVNPLESGSNPEFLVNKEDLVRPRELGGPAGPEPTRYGDWERKGRCIDF